MPKRVDGFLGTMKRYYGAIAYDYLTENKLLIKNTPYTENILTSSLFRQNAAFYTLAKSGFREGYLFNLGDSGHKAGKENFDLTFRTIDSAAANKIYDSNEELYNDMFLYNIRNEGGFSYSNHLDANKAYALKTFGLIPNTLSNYSIEDFYNIINNNVVTGFSSSRIIENFPGKTIKASDAVIRTGQANYEEEHRETPALHHTIFTGSVSGNYAPATLNPNSNLNLMALEGLYEADKNEFAALNVTAVSPYDAYEEENLLQSVKNTGIFWDNPTFIVNNQRTFLGDSSSFPFAEGFAISNIHNFLIALEPKKYYPSERAPDFIDEKGQTQILVYDPASDSYVYETNEDSFDFDPTEVDLEKFQTTNILEQLDLTYKSNRYQETNATISSLTNVPFFLRKTELNLPRSISTKTQVWNYLGYKNSDRFDSAPKPTGVADGRFSVITPADGVKYGQIITDAPSTKGNFLSLLSFSNNPGPAPGKEISPAFDIPGNQRYPTITNHTKFYRVILPNFTAEKLVITYSVGNPDQIGGTIYCNEKFNQIDGNTQNPIYFQVYANGNPVLSKMFTSFSDAVRESIELSRADIFKSQTPPAGPIKVWIDICPNNHPYNAVSFGGYSALNCDTLTSSFTEFDFDVDNCIKIKVEQTK